jgi:hypothetical protein
MNNIMVNKICVRCGMEYPDHKMSCKIPVEEWRLPTAEETYFKITNCVMNHKDIKTAMIEFTKLHLEAQLEAILKNVKLDMKKKSLYNKKSRWKKVPLKEQEEGVDIFSYECQTFVDKNSIIKAYPLNNVK